MTITKRGKELAEAIGTSQQQVCSLIARHTVTYQQLQVDACNGHPCHSSPTMPINRVSRLQEAWDARIEKGEGRLEKRITELVSAIPEILSVEFGGDPRGHVVKLHLANGKYNSWGGVENGYGVPV